MNLLSLGSHTVLNGSRKEEKSGSILELRVQC